MTFYFPMIILVLSRPFHCSGMLVYHCDVYAWHR